VLDNIFRCWSPAGQRWNVLEEDPALLVFPLLSSIVLLVLLGSLALPVFALYHSLQPALAEGKTTQDLIWFLPGLARTSEEWKPRIFAESPAGTSAMRSSR
jgi:hypothetical protein